MQEQLKEQSPQPQRKRRTKRLSTVNEEFDLSLFVIIAQKKWRWMVLILLISIITAVLYLRYAERIYEENTTVQIGSDNTANKVLQTTPNGGLFQNTGDELAEAVELMKSKLFIERVFRALPMQVSYYTEGTFKNHEQYLNAPYIAVPDSEATRSLKETKINVRINNLAGGYISFFKDGKQQSYNYTTDEWITTSYGKLKIHVTNFPEIEKTQTSVKKSPYFFIINDYDQLAAIYSRQITVRLLNQDAKTLQVSCRDYNDRKASDIANSMAEEYIRYDLEKRSKSAESVLNFIDEQLDVVYSKIKSTEGALDTFQRSNKINPAQEVVTANLTRLSNLQDQIAATDYQEKALFHVERELQSKKDIDPKELIGLMEGDDYGTTLTENLTNLHNLVIEQEHNLYDVTPNNQSALHLAKEVEEQKTLVTKGIDALLSKLDAKKQDLENEASSIENQYLSGSSGNNIEYLRLQRLFSIDEKYYDLLLEKKTEYSISKAGFVAESQILENSIPNWVPVSPRKTSTFIIAFLAAISMAIILLFIIYLFYNELTSIEEIERLAESPITILGIVPEYKKTIPVSQLIINNNPKSILAESFRSIRTNLQFVQSGDEAKIIAITSTISGEGKTFVSINLGGIIAFSGKKVIILDLDMRKPRIHTALGLDNSKGMSTLLIGKYSIEEVVQTTETNNLHIITAGPIPPNPSELVISDAMDKILEKLKTQYDIIIIDNPPVGLVTDGIMMLQKADYPIYVMRADYSKREFIHFIDRLYFENQFHRLSIVLNGVDFKKQAYSYGYYGYGYTYGQGEYYEA